MHRLVIVAGPNRGSSFSLVEGENSIGRQVDNHIVLTSSKVSKRHSILLVRANEVTLVDQESMNGTFLNGGLIRRQKIKPGDKIGIGDFVLELVRTGAFSNLPALGSSGTQYPGTQYSGNNALSVSPEPMKAFRPPTPVKREVVMPEDLDGKLKFTFEEKIMPPFYGMLMKGEYSSLVAMIIGVLVAVSVVSAGMPIQDLAEKAVRKEALLRAKVLAREVADRALPSIANHVESQIDLSLLENEESVKIVAIVNPNLQIIAPQTRLDQRFAGGPEAMFALQTSKAFQAGRETGMGGLVSESVAIYIEPIKTTDPRAPSMKVAALAIVAIDFSGSLLQSGGMGVAYGIGFVVAGILGILSYFIVLRLSFKPYEVLNEDLDQVLRGELPRVTREFQVKETAALFDNINAAIQRLPKGGREASSDHSLSSVVNWDQELSSVRAICNDFSIGGFVAFDQSLTMIALNPQFEEISGIRSENIGQNLQQVARDQAFVSFVTDFQDRVTQSPSRSAQGDTPFEFSGTAYDTAAVAVGPASQPGFAILFRRRS